VGSEVPAPGPAPTGLGDSETVKLPMAVTNNLNEDSEAGSSLMYNTSHWHPGFELPFDLESFNAAVAALEFEPIPEPTAAEVAAHQFLRRSLQGF
jgi:hypothetical protein